MIERLKELLEKSTKEGLSLNEVKELSPLLSDEVRERQEENPLSALSLGLVLFKVDCFLLEHM